VVGALVMDGSLSIFCSVMSRTLLRRRNFVYRNIFG
jgi:hypothetical protein